MLLLIAVLAFLSAAFLLFRFTRQHDPDLFIQHPVSFEPPPNARPLFAPSEAELRRETDHIAARRIAQREYRANAKARATVDAAIFNWRKERDSKNTLELLRVTAESGLDGDFSRAAREILEFFHKSGINGLKNDEMAV